MEQQRKQRTRWMGLMAFALLLYGAGSFYQPTIVVGESMSPTLETGRVIWIDRTYYNTHAPKRGEVVVFESGGEVYVKRVYRGPGESLHYLANNGAWIGPVREARTEEVRVHYAGRGPLEVLEMRIPEDSVYVLGDNYNCSEDSRDFGPVPISSILGRAHLEVDTTKVMEYEHVPPRRNHFAAR
jgi:signal peptidase I